MKNIFRISVIVILTLALAFTVFSVNGTGSELAAASVCSDVGWNTRATSCSSCEILPKVGWNTRVASCPPGGVMPQVGWNT